ncbi:MerR family transcriptional regulator [Brevibacterium aurantiacum]|uniref:MerR family DNA-binding transcriptional regulator n=1 Tax=Brevibacterium aurantiacum TaxID=273384 RepID=A0A556C3V3_BREAU|nr:MerR family transcriptional regulator [Brevibacterium aurantiacum]TSI12133.1 MerR family DNA-binding transcriptional regulator [Brevibacterium aurantiacum]
MRISELARLTGLAPSAIRYYEQQDMFSTGQILRQSNGYRDYTSGAQRRLELILAGRVAGFSLVQMRERMRDWDEMTAEQRVVLLEKQLEVIEERIADLQRGRATVCKAITELETRRFG